MVVSVRKGVQITTVSVGKLEGDAQPSACVLIA